MSQRKLEQNSLVCFNGDLHLLINCKIAFRNSRSVCLNTNRCLCKIYTISTTKHHIYLLPTCVCTEKGQPCPVKSMDGKLPIYIL